MTNSESTKKQARTFIGTVVSDLMNKTIVVKVDRMKMHSKYNKSYLVSRKYHVHDEKEAANIGDKVEFKECRPISKTKRWYLLKIFEKK